MTVFEYILSYDDEEVGRGRQEAGRGRKRQEDLKNVIGLSCLSFVCPAFQAKPFV
jgi:hypothetical protein